MKRYTILSLSIVVASLVVLSACSDAAQITTRYAPSYTHTPHLVSLLGVYKDGRMNPDVWEQIGPGLSVPLGGHCLPGYDTLVTSNPELSAAIDDYARANGIGDELLDQLGPAAKGDLVMVVTVAGHVTQKGEDLPDTSAVSGGAPASMGNKYRGGSTGGSGMGGMGNTRGPSGAMRRPRALADGAAFEMSASLFSIREHRSVGLVSMAYSGPSVDDAVSKLATRLGVELSGSTCASWDWTAKIDGQHIREMVEH
jgi:hypothetical protein